MCRFCNSGPDLVLVVLALGLAVEFLGLGLVGLGLDIASFVNIPDELN